MHKGLNFRLGLYFIIKNKRDFIRMHLVTQS